MTILTLDAIEAEIDKAVTLTAAERADTGYRLNHRLKALPVTRRSAQVRACVLTCLLAIPAGGPLHIPTCEKHRHE